MNARSLRIGVVAALSFAVALPCRAGLFDQPPSFLVAESPLQVPDAFLSPNDVFWLDNHTLVFAGADNGAEPPFWRRATLDEVQFPEAKAHLYIWRQGEEPRVYERARWPKPGSRLYQNYLCAGAGRIVWSTDGFAAPERRERASRPATVMAGLPGKETASSFVFSADLSHYPRDFRHWDLSLADRSCAQVAAPALNGHLWVPSRSASFALDFGPYDPKAKDHPPLSVASLADGKRVPVRGLDARGVSEECTLALPWEDSIVTWGCPVTWKMHPDLVPVWKVRADGSSQRIDMHTGNLVLDHLVPFRNGFFLWSDGSRSDESHMTIADAGLYLVRKDGSLKRVLAGSQWWPRAISPDGCLAAFARSTSPAGIIFRQHLAVLDLCKAATL